MLAVSAPVGFGKTVAIAHWLRQRSSAAYVIWISCGEFIATEEAVWATVSSGLKDVGLWLSGEAPEMETAAAFAALQSLSQEIVVVYDDLDRIGTLDLHRLAQLDRLIPTVRTIAIATGPPRSQADVEPFEWTELGSNQLAWDHVMIRAAAAAANAPSDGRLAVESIVNATKGRPGAILHYLGAWSASGGALRTPASTLTLRWSLDTLRQLDTSGDILTLFAILAVSIRVPVTLLDDLVGSPVAHLLDILIGTGLVTWSGAPGLCAEVVNPGEDLIEEFAAQVLGERAPEVHRRAAEYFLQAVPAFAIHHLARSGDSLAALGLFRRLWNDVGVGSDLADIRRASSAISDDAYRSDLHALAIRMLASRLPPTEVVRRRHLESFLLSAPPSRLAQLPFEERPMVVAASIWALVSRDRVTEAAAMGVKFADELRAFTWPNERAQLIDQFSVLWNITGEALLLTGQPRAALSYIKRAWELVDARRSPVIHFASVSLAALAFAMNGELAEGRSRLAVARDSYAAMMLPPSAIEYPLALTEAILAHADADAQGMLRAAQAFTRVAGEEARWSAAADLCRAFALYFSGQFDAALSAIRKVLHSAGAKRSPTVALLMAVGLEAEVSIALGRPTRAVELLNDSRVPRGHSLCPSAQRATGLLASGQPRMALAETDVCVSLGTEHSLRTLPAVFLRRALAHAQLGHDVAADESFLEGFLLLRDSMNRAAFLNLSREAVDLLLSRLLESHPEYAVDAALLADALDSMDHLMKHDRIPAILTDRERRVLAHLATGQTVPQIASALFVSPNTVKTQVRSLYRKLGIASRKEAAEVAAALRLHLNEG